MHSRHRALFFATIVLLVAPTASGAEPSRLGPPNADGPVTVSVGLFVSDVNEVDERRETFEFEGILTLKWQDPRQAFDPGEVGVGERTYQGNYQFSEIFDGWWPQLILSNKSGIFDSQAVLLRIAPNGAATLVSEFHAVAEIPMKLRRFPFDHQDFHAVFEVLGLGQNRVLLVPDPATTSGVDQRLNVPQWEFRDLRVAAGEYHPVYEDGHDGALSRIIFTLEMARQPAHVLLVVVFPLTLLVALTFAVFWMDQSSLGDRMDISFLGILTVVAFQIVVNQSMPGIAYFTLMSGFLYSTYLILAVCVIMNLVVSKLDESGRRKLGDRVDRACRWAVPAGFVGVNALSAGYFLTFY